MNSHTLTKIRTKVQFTQYGDVKTFVYVGNKLQAMNAIKYGYGVKSFSILYEYKTDGYLTEGTILTN
jgi:hypothetical protein